MTVPDATPEAKALAVVIWTTSRADESTISGIGADKVAAAILSSDWLAQRDARIKAEAVQAALDEIAARVEAALVEVKGADFGTVLVATTNAYSDACRDLTRRIEAQS